MWPMSSSALGGNGHTTVSPVLHQRSGGLSGQAPWVGNRAHHRLTRSASTLGRPIRSSALGGEKGAPSSHPLCSNAWPGQATKEETRQGTFFTQVWYGLP